MVNHSLLCIANSPVSKSSQWPCHYALPLPIDDTNRYACCSITVIEVVGKMTQGTLRLYTPWWWDKCENYIIMHIAPCLLLLLMLPADPLYQRVLLWPTPLPLVRTILLSICRSLFKFLATQWSTYTHNTPTQPICICSRSKHTINILHTSKRLIN